MSEEIHIMHVNSWFINYLYFSGEQSPQILLTIIVFGKH